MKTLISLMCVLVFCSNSCEDPPFVEKFYRIIITNKSSKIIRVLLDDDTEANQYPNVALPILKPALQKIASGASGYYDSKTTWQENLMKLPKDTLSVYFIDNAVYENEPWDDIRINNKILKRMDLSIQDLEQVNFKLSFDGN